MNLNSKGIKKFRNRGFTMVEIALSIAVVALAMVAIMGVLPTGMTVERENQEDILINQEGAYWIEAIRSGSRGIRDITNYVESINIEHSLSILPEISLTNGTPIIFPPDLIIGLLSMPKYDRNPTNMAIINTKKVTAVVKAMTGSAAEKGPLTNEFSFRYQLEVGISPDINALGVDTNLFSRSLMQNLHNVRVVLRWPVYERAGGFAVGNNRKVFRAKVSGVITNQIFSLPGMDLGLSFIKPNLYAHAGY